MKIEKEDVNVEGQRPHKVIKKNQKANTNSADKLTNKSRIVKKLKKKEKEIEGDGYEEEAVKEGSQTQQRGRVLMKLFFFSPTPSFVSVVISIPYFISFYEVMKYTETIQ